MTDTEKLDLILQKLENHDQKFEQIGNQITELKVTDNLILKEIERVQNILQDKIDRVQKNMDELNQFYRINKLENDNTSILLKMIDDLSKRVAELEKRSA